MDTYDEARKCSPSEDDVRALVAGLENLKKPLPDPAFIDAAEVTFASADGYVLGQWWWDSESEVWRLDIRLWGESR